MKECKSCIQRSIIKQGHAEKSVFYNRCKLGKREDSLYPEDDFRGTSCEKFEALECEIVEFKKKEIFR